MNELALFAGAGGGILGGKLLGWHTIGAVELEEYPREILKQRQDDGILELFPIWDDVRTFDGGPWRGLVDVITGGFPCQDISAAGKGAGLAGSRSGLWFEMLRIIGEVRPRFVFAENSPVLRTRGLGTVIEGLAGLGYDVRWCVLGAGDVGAHHKRKRMWLLAHSNDPRQRPSKGAIPGHRRDHIGIRRKVLANADGVELREQLRWVSREGGESTSQPRDDGGEGYVANPNGKPPQWLAKPWSECGEWPTEPAMGRVAHGVAGRVDRLKALGNGQVPRVAAVAWSILSRGWV